MQDQKDCVLNVLEELGHAQLFLKNQYSTGFFLVSSSSSCQACFPLATGQMRAIQETFLKIFSNSPELNGSIFFSIHMLWMTKKTHHFLRYFIIGERIFPWFNISPSSLPNGNCSWEKPAGSLLCGFGLAFDRHAKSFASNFNAYSSSWPSEFIAHCCSNSSQTCVIPEKFWPKSECCLCSKTQFWFYDANNWLQLPIRAQSLCSLGSILLVVMLLL